MKNLAAVLILSVIATVGLFTTFRGSRVLGEDISGSSLFELTGDSVTGYRIVSDHIFPLKIYALSLPEISGYGVSNHSAILDGVRQAVLVHPPDAQPVYPGQPEIKELTVGLGVSLDMKLKVNVSLVLVEDWESYKTLVESSNDTIIVNTYGEYLPVPESYTNEQWVDKIADLMLNHWGTWVHAGGYPFYRVWYQNGTIEEWGERGFQRLMSHIGKENVTCYPPLGDDPETFSLEDLFLSYWWSTYGGVIGNFHYAAHGFPVKHKDFDVEFSVYDFMENNGSMYSSGAAIRFAPNITSFNFGTYVHMGTWEFYNIDGAEWPSDFAASFTATATAIYSEYACAAFKFFGKQGESASEAFQKAQNEGRKIGLDKAQAHFESALNAFAAGHYKLSASYLDQAKSEAENAQKLQQDYLLQGVVAVVIAAVPIGVVVYFKFGNKKRKPET